MINKLVPDYIFEGFKEITPLFLCGIGVRTVISDIDNTLAPYEETVAGDGVAAWFAGLRRYGINAALISNNNAGRVIQFNSRLGLPAYPRSGKPGTKYIRAAMDELGCAAGETVIIGDQIFTDVLAGKLLGLHTILVRPIRDKKNLLIKAKRLLEIPVIKRYYKNLNRNH